MTASLTTIRRRARRGGAIAGLAAFIALSAAAGGMPPFFAAPSYGPPSSGPTTTRAADVDPLTKRLLAGKSTDVDAQTRLLEAMDEAQRRLIDEYDAGEQTRAAQTRALAALDEAIEQAKQQDRAASSNSRGKSGERRGPGKADGRRPGTTSAPSGRDPRAAAAPSTQPGRADRTGIGAEGDRQRRWGHLPPRDRAELSQGQDEQFPSKYREQIERYYRSLAEEGARP